MKYEITTDRRREEIVSPTALNDNTRYLSSSLYLDIACPVQWRVESVEMNHYPSSEQGNCAKSLSERLKMLKSKLRNQMCRRYSDLTFRQCIEIDKCDVMILHKNDS